MVGEGILKTGLEGKVVLVTGGTRGIGVEIVRQFARQGSYTVFIGRNQEAGKGLELELGQEGYEGMFYCANLLSAPGCMGAVRFVANYGKEKTKTLGEYDKIDILVNCAGYNDGLGPDCGRDSIRESLDLNLGQYIHMISLCWKYLKASKGNVVNIGSKTGEFGQKGSWVYSAANGGIDTLTKSAARDGTEYGIRVNCVIPSEVDGAHWREWAREAGKDFEEEARRVPLGHRMTTEAEIANAVLFLASPLLSSHTTGAFLKVNGGYPQLLE